jgi:3-oxoacyl-[acyl-carrier protein] reductase
MIAGMSSGQRVAFVTGSSRGLGAVIARRLGRDGFAVAVNGLPGDGRADEVVADIRDAGGVAQLFEGDVTDQDAVAQLVAEIRDGLGAVDVVVVNATGPQPNGAVLEVGWEEHLKQLDFFVKSPVLLGREIVPGMRERNYGRSILRLRFARRRAGRRTRRRRPRRLASRGVGHASWRRMGSL